MSKQNLKNILSVSARVLLAFVFVFAQTAWAAQNQNDKDKSNTGGSAKAQQSQASPPPVPAAKTRPAEDENAAEQTVVAQEKFSANDRHEGIKVHGHWTIEVRNPNGTVVTHREFENSLTSTGSAGLASLLARQNSVGAWSVSVSGNVCNFPSGQVGNGCVLDEPFNTSRVGLVYAFQTLTVTNSGNSLILAGTATASNSGSINAVLTQNLACSASSQPSAPCNPGGAPTAIINLTSTTLNPVISISAGQTIAVTVNISFS